MKRHRVFACVCAWIGIACHLQAAGYIKFDGIDGESKDADHKQWIDVLSASGVPAARDAASGQATGRRAHEPIRISKRIDKASPILAKAKADGTVIPRVELSVDGKACVLTNARISSVSVDGGNETVAFTFEKIEWKTNAPPAGPSRPEPAVGTPQPSQSPRPSGG